MEHEAGSAGFIDLGSLGKALRFMLPAAGGGGGRYKGLPG